MTISRASAFVVMAALVALLTMVGDARQTDPGVQLRGAIEKEEVTGDLEGAMTLYRQIIAANGKNRAVTARAMLHLAGCHEKLGQAEARKVYERLVAEFSDQTQEAASARARLAALATVAAAPAGDSRLIVRRVPDLDASAKPSPDGKYLAFTDWTSGNLAILDVVTGTKRTLTKDGTILGETLRFPLRSAWSRDNRQIACGWIVQQPKGDAAELRIVSIEGNTAHETIAIPGARWIWPLDWSPDSARILCWYGPSGGGTSLALVNVRAHTIEQVAVDDHGYGPCFSGDGQAVLYSAPGDGEAGPNDIFVRDLKTGGTTSIVQHPADDLLVGVLPGTDWLFFASDRRSGRLDLWAVPLRRGRADGQPVFVREGLGRSMPLGFTSDGRFYYGTVTNTMDVFLTDFDRGTGKAIGEARKLNSRWDGSNGQPAFSPDGASLAYVVNRSQMLLRTSAFDSLVVQSLKDQAADPVIVGFEELGLFGVAAPCWLADGNGVVLAGYRNRPQETALYRVDLPGLRKTRIYAVPDGRRLDTHACGRGGPFIYAQLSTRASGQSTEQQDQIIRIDLTGGPEREVFHAPQGQLASYAIALSPDGRSLSTITRLDRYRRTLWVMPSEGGTPRQVLEFQVRVGGVVDHVWSPDGHYILYDEQGEQKASSLRRVQAAGAGSQPETVMQFGGQLFGLSFHPDGRLLAFTGRSMDASSTSGVWVMENLREELKTLTSPAK
jgi:Tol biopolymer transport system component